MPKDLTSREFIEKKFSYLKGHLAENATWADIVERIRGVIIAVLQDEKYPPHQIVGDEFRNTVVTIRRHLKKLSDLDKNATQHLWSHSVPFPLSPHNCSDPLLEHNALIADCDDFLELPTQKSFRAQQTRLIVDLLDQVREECLTIELSKARTSLFSRMVFDVANSIFPDKVYADAPRKWIRAHMNQSKNECNFEEKAGTEMN
jgi:hypothetical protein